MMQSNASNGVDGNDAAAAAPLEGSCLPCESQPTSTTTHNNKKLFRGFTSVLDDDGEDVDDDHRQRRRLSPHSIANLPSPLEDVATAGEKISRNQLPGSTTEEILHGPSPRCFDDDETKLTVWQVLAYAVGHVCNDMCSSCWFTYLLIFLEDVAGQSASEAGIVMFAGQIADALATPLAGLSSDLTPGVAWCRGTARFGPRKTLHLIGTIIVLICFFGVFGYNPLSHSHHDDGGGEQKKSSNLVYYILAASLFNVGWAAVQVSHLALIPELSSLEHERVRLVSFRYTFTVLSNLTVFLLYLHGPESVSKYRSITFATLGAGLFFDLVFWGFTREPPRKRKRKKTRPNNKKKKKKNNSLRRTRNNDGDDDDETLTEGLLEDNDNEDAAAAADDDDDERALSLSSAPAGPSTLAWTWSSWFGVGDFYFVGLTYMTTRIVVNFSQVYLPFYLQEVMYEGNKTAASQSLALVPLTLYLSSFVATLRLEYINRLFGRKAAYSLGTILVVGACLTLYLLPSKGRQDYVYLPAIILGLGNATIMVTSVSLESDLIGEKTSSGAFVYGFLSFLDKLSTGVLILVVQKLKANVCHDDVGDNDHVQQASSSALSSSPTTCPGLIRLCISTVPAVAVLIGLMSTLAIKEKAKTRHQSHEEEGRRQEHHQNQRHHPDALGIREL